MARMTWAPEAVVEYLLAAGSQNNYIKTGGCANEPRGGRGGGGEDNHG